jgi:anti-sigma factor RsiW
MSDGEPGLSDRELADLGALADGSLPAERRAEVEARVAASPALRDAAERQRVAVAAAQALAGDRPSPALVASVDALQPRRRRRAPRLALAGGLAAVAAIVAAIVLTGGPSGPSVADAARLATQPANAPAPAPTVPGSTRLAADVEGVPFPDLAAFAGWQVTGVRRGQVNGRDATAVFYEKGGRRIAYVIVAGSALSTPSAGSATSQGGVEYRTLQLNGRPAVTWRRAGHTCILVGDAAGSELLQLATWRY